MPLQVGTRIGPYEVSAPLGEGGMGEVYRATDTNLKRGVAIKVLPASVSADVERLARFQREAEVLAALNHPNIAAIYGLERGADVTALVMELVEGPTLADRIAQGAVPLDEALAIASQIADALGAAHEQGIVHRDLKPANIKVRPDGTVKVLDFGLAKAVETQARADGPAKAGPYNESMSPTITSPAMTQLGMILGTAAYMAPEQASGKPVDKRADIWAFGVVLWEMLTGRQMFDGETIAHVLAAVLTKEPDLDVVPPRVRSLLTRCLQKDPKKRLRDVGDAMSLVQDRDAAAPVANARARRTALSGWAAAVVIAAVAATTLMWRTPSPIAVTHPPLVRFQISRASIDPYNNATASFALSPDGTYLAYYVSDKGLPSLKLRTLATGEFRDVPGSTLLSTGQPVWSPDSKQLIFLTASAANVYDLAVGTSRQLCTCRFRGGAWNRDGVILLGAFPAGGGPIRQVSFGDRAARDITTVDAAKREQDTLPRFLPDGKRFLFTRSTAGVAPVTYLGTLDGAAPQRLVEGWSRSLFVPALNGVGPFVMGIDDAGLVAQALDLDTMTIAKEAVVIAPGAFSASLSDNGILATSVRGNRPSLIPTWFDRAGTAVGTIGAAGVVESVALAADGGKIATSETRDGGPNDVWVRDLASGANSRLTFDPANDADPVWAPDGTRVVFASNREGVANLVERPADGTGSDTRIFAAERNAYVNDWSLDGRWIIYTLPKTEGQVDLDLWAVPMSPGVERKPVVYLTTPGRKAQAAFSPDNRFVAYISDETGTSEVYVQPFPDASGGKWMISSGGGVEPRWGRDGKELFYFSGQTLMSVPVSLQPTFSQRPAVRLFDAPVQTGYVNDSDRWQVSPDGKRFLLLLPAGRNESPPIDVVVNWPSLLANRNTTK